MTKFSELNLLSIGNTIQMVGAIYAGEGKMFLCLFPEDRGELTSCYSGGKHVIRFEVKGREDEVSVLDMTSAEWEIFLRQTDIMETEILTKASDGTLAKAIARKSQRQIASEVSWAVFRRDGYKCRYCAADNVPLTVDHLVLWEEGGPSTENNLICSCRRCNKVRANTQYPDWLVHGHYKRSSKNLDEATRRLNLQVAETLNAIPRMLHKPNRRH